MKSANAFKTAIGNRATSAGRRAYRVAQPIVERRMLSAEEETSHANDAGFDAGRPGAVGYPSKCSTASWGAASLARRHERVFGPSTHEALILLYVGPQEHRQTGGVRATGASAGYGRLSSTLFHYRSGPPESRPSNPEISADGPATAGKSATAGSLVPQA